MKRSSIRRGADLGPARRRAGRLGARREEIPLVILSNASDDQIQKNVAQLGAPSTGLHRAARRRPTSALQAFEYMLDSLNANPEDMLHVSSSLRYDLMSADDLGIRTRCS